MKNEQNEPDLIDLVQSSAREIENFEKSTIWNDITNILKDWQDGLRQDYDNANSMEDVKFLQGISKGISYMLNLPLAMKNIVLQAQEDKNES